MLAKILGWFWVVAGIIFLLKPQLLKNRVQKKGLKALRKYFFIISMLAGMFLIGAGWRFEGILAKIIIIVAIVEILKGIFFLKSKAAEKMLEYITQMPVAYYRIGACAYIVLGIILLILK